MTDAVVISEVGPRDGLQSISTLMPTEAKCRWIDALVAAGMQEIEVGSFVSAKRLPQMADTAQVVQHATQHTGLRVVALVPNLQGAQAALQAGVHKITVPVSASEAHSVANVNKTHAQMLQELAQVVQAVRAHNAARPGEAPVGVEVGMSTAFGCTLQGPVPADTVIRLAEACVQAGVDEVGLSDTTGMANPRMVRERFRQLRQALGHHAGAAHLHNTRGLGLANALAAYEEGVRAFDSSLAGLGGCPYAPGASGNVVTEDLVFMFEAMGVKTGIHFEGLMHARALLHQALPHEPLYGMTPEAGLPKGFEWSNR
jgi:hydroxymethylglutaryl-CoA lyase